MFLKLDNFIWRATWCDVLNKTLYSLLEAKRHTLTSEENLSKSCKCSFKGWWSIMRGPRASMESMAGANRICLLKFLATRVRSNQPCRCESDKQKFVKVYINISHITKKRNSRTRSTRNSPPSYHQLLTKNHFRLYCSTYLDGGIVWVTAHAMRVRQWFYLPHDSCPSHTPERFRTKSTEQELRAHAQKFTTLSPQSAT